VIIGIGVDIADIRRFKMLVERYGERFAQRILSESEQLEFGQSKNQPSFLAKRFAVKEAAAKALGTGFGKGLHPRQISLTHTELGAPILMLSDKAHLIWQKLGCNQSHVSLSDEKDHAIAFVVLSNQ